MKEFFSSIGIQAQIDFGNFTVGIATLFLALVSLWIAFGNRQQNSSQKVAEFRIQWISDLRHSVSEIIALSDQLRRIFLLSVFEEVNRNDTVELFNKFGYYKIKILLYLNENEDHHKKIIVSIDELDEMINNFGHMSHNPSNNMENITKLNIEMRACVDAIRTNTRRALKIEWNRVKTEVK
jgi:hypothetical protein